MSRALLQIASQSWGDSLPFGKSPRRQHRSPFPAGSALSEPSAEWLEPSGHTHVVSQLSHRPPLGEPQPFVLTAPCLMLPAPRRGKGGGLNAVQAGLAAPLPPAQRSEAAQCSIEGRRTRRSFGQVQVVPRCPASSVSGCRLVAAAQINLGWKVLDQARVPYSLLFVVPLV